MNDELLNKVSKKSGVDKNIILDLARNLSNGNMKDEKALGNIIDKLSKATGKNVSSDLKQKIIKAVKEDKVPKNLDKMF